MSAVAGASRLAVALASELGPFASSSAAVGTACGDEVCERVESTVL